MEAYVRCLRMGCRCIECKHSLKFRSFVFFSTCPDQTGRTFAVHCNSKAFLTCPHGFACPENQVPSIARVSVFSGLLGWSGQPAGDLPRVYAHIEDQVRRRS